MATLNQPFNPANFNPELGMRALPLGLKQPVRAISSEVKAAQGNSNSGMLVYTVEILDGPNKGQQGNLNFNIYNQSAEAADIAWRSLSAMSHCCGVLQQWTDTATLHNLPFMIDVTPQKVKQGQEDKGYTEVSAYYDINGNKPRHGMVNQPVQNNGQQQQNGQQQNNNFNGQQQQNNNGGGFNNQQDPNQQQQNNGGGFNNQQQNPQTNQQQPANNGGGWNNGQNTQQQPANNNGQGGTGGAPWANANR